MKPKSRNKTPGQISGEAFRAWLALQPRNDGGVGWSYQDFAKASGFPYTTVMKWGRGAIPRYASVELLRLKYPGIPLITGALAPA